MVFFGRRKKDIIKECRLQERKGGGGGRYKRDHLLLLLLLWGVRVSLPAMAIFLFMRRHSLGWRSVQ